VESIEAVRPQLAALARAVGLPDAPDGAGVPDVAVVRPRFDAFVPVWRRPWMTVNARTYGSSLLASIGVGNVFAGAADRYPEVTLDEARARAPDVVLAPSEPYPFGERHRAELARVAPVLFVDGRDLFWWGVRTPAARARLAQLSDRRDDAATPTAAGEPRAVHAARRGQPCDEAVERRRAYLVVVAQAGVRRGHELAGGDGVAGPERGDELVHPRDLGDHVTRPLADRGVLDR